MCSTRVALVRTQTQTTPPRTLRQQPTQAASSTAAERPLRIAQSSANGGSARGQWRVYLAEPPSTNTTRLEGTEADGTMYVSLGGARAQIRQENTSWSRDVILGGIVAASRTQSGWLFASGDGAHYRAPYFTGPLSLVSSLSSASLVRSFASQDRVLVQDSQNQLWIGGAAGWATLQNPPGARFINGGFLSNAVGVAVFSPGQARASNDGGAHWQALDLQQEAVTELIAITDGYVLKTLTRAYRLDSQLHVSAFSGLAIAVPSVIPALENVRLSFATNGPSTRASALMRDGFTLDGTQIFASFINREPTNRFGAVRRPTTSPGDTLHVIDAQGEVAHFDAVGSDCKYLPLGRKLVATCRTSAYQPSTIFLLSPGEAWAPLSRPPGFYYTLDFATSTDGETVWTLNVPCDARNRLSGGPTWCHLRPAQVPLAPSESGSAVDTTASGWTAFNVERGAEFVASFGDYVLYQTRNGALDSQGPGPLRVQRIDAGPESARAPARSDNRARLHTGEFTQDGTFFSRTSVGTAAALAVGSLDRALAIRPLPTGAVDVGMIDQAHGLAVGARLHQLWSTQDAGNTWQPITHAVHGDAASVLIDPSQPVASERLHCRWWGCVIANRLLWANESLVGTAPPEAFASPTPPTEHEVTATVVAPNSLDFGTQRCAPSTQVEPNERYRLGAGGWLKIESDYRVEWSATDARGAFHAVVQQRPPPQDPAPPWPALSTILAPRWLSRDYALVERCAYSSLNRYVTPEISCDLLLFSRRQGQVTLWLSPKAQPGFSDPHLSVRIAELVGLPDGDIALRVATGPIDEPLMNPETAVTQRRFEQHPRLDWIVRAHVDGTIVSQKSFVWARDEARLRMLASDGQQLGVAIVEGGRQPHRVVKFFRSPGESPVDLGAIPLRTRPCGTEPRPSNPWAISSANDGNILIRAGREIDGTGLLHGTDGVQSTLEFGSSGTCLRRVSVGQGTFSTLSRFDNTFRRLGGSVTLEAHGGDFDLRFHSPIRSLTMTCIADPAFR